MSPWLAQDGLMKLLTTEHREHEGVGTVENDNGILWVAYWYYMRGDPLSPEHYLQLERHGYFAPRPPRSIGDPRINSKDNLIGTQALLVSMDHRTPGTGLWLHADGWKIRQRETKETRLIQPGDRAWFEVTSGREPHFLGLLHFAAGTLLNAYIAKTGWLLADNYENGMLLTWLRLKVLDRKSQVPWLWRTVSKFWQKKLLEKTSGEGISFFARACFNEFHPVKEAAVGKVY